MATNEQIIWNYLYKNIGNAYGAAGLMGNIYAESGLSPTNVQDSYEKKLGMNDEQYTAAVDNGSYTNFVKDSAGYGLCQWTYWSRKQNLLSYANEKGTSIGDLNMQLGFLMKEIKANSSIYSTLQSATSVQEASDIVMKKFENPYDQSQAAMNRRASYGQKFYDKFAGDINVPSKSEEFSAYKVKCTAISLNVRTNPDTHASLLGTIKLNHQFTIRGESNGWGKVCLYLDKPKGKVADGWVYLKYTKKI